MPCVATDLASGWPRGALDQAISTLVVQETHPWLNLAQMRDAEEVRFLDAPILQVGTVW